MKWYSIELGGGYDGEGGETKRMLTQKEFELVSGIISDINSRGSSDYAPWIGIEEVKVVARDVKEIDGGFTAWLENADHVVVGQRMVYYWNGITEFKVKSIGEKMRYKYDDNMREAILVYCGKREAKPICSGSTLETEYKED